MICVRKQKKTKLILILSKIDPSLLAFSILYEYVFLVFNIRDLSINVRHNSTIPVSTILFLLFPFVHHYSHLLYALLFFSLLFSSLLFSSHLISLRFFSSFLIPSLLMLYHLFSPHLSSSLLICSLLLPCERFLNLDSLGRQLCKMEFLRFDYQFVSKIKNKFMSKNEIK